MEEKETQNKSKENLEQKTEDDKAVEKFFSLLFEIDKRKNPDIYKNL